MTRLFVLLLAAGAGLTLSPASASAQFGPGYPNFRNPVIVPSFNPFYYVPQYRYQSGFSLNVPTPYGPSTIATSRYYYGVNNPAAVLGSAYPSLYLQGGSATSGGAGMRTNFALQAQRDLAAAQRAMSAPGGSSTSSSSGTRPAAGGEAGPVVPDGFGRALAPADRARVLSGEALNDLLAAVVKAEPKGGNRPSAFVPGDSTGRSPVRRVGCSRSTEPDPSREQHEFPGRIR